MATKFKNYLLIFSLTFLIGGAPLLLNFLFITQAYENASYKEIVNTQAKENALYGSALNANDLNYKIELVRKRRPDVVSWGSSRTMQIREEEFRAPFTNCGGVFSTLNEGAAFFKSMISVHKPKLIIWGLDYWWFNKKWETDERRRFVDETAITQEKLIEPFEWFREGKLTLHDYFSVLLGNRKNSYTNYLNLGIHAIKTSDGYRSDGSYNEMSAILDLKDDRIKGLQKELKTILDETDVRAKLGYDDFIDKDRWAQFVSLMKEVRKNNIQFLLFLPPVAPDFMDAIRDKKRHDFVEKLAERLRSLNEEFYDFTDSRQFHVDKREFSDGWHVGEVGYLRLLQEINRHNPKSNLIPYLRTKDFSGIIKKFSGRLLILFPGDEKLYSQPERLY